MNERHVEFKDLKDRIFRLEERVKDLQTNLDCERASFKIYQDTVSKGMGFMMQLIEFKANLAKTEAGGALKRQVYFDALDCIRRFLFLM